MAISIFDTHKFVRRMEAAGLTLEQAEAQADVLTEVFTVNLETLVTKDFLESRLEASFAKQDAKIESNHRIFLWTQAIVMAAVILPLFERLAAI